MDLPYRVHSHESVPWPGGEILDQGKVVLFRNIHFILTSACSVLGWRLWSGRIYKFILAQVLRPIRCCLPAEFHPWISSCNIIPWAAHYVESSEYRLAESYRTSLVLCRNLCLDWTDQCIGEHFDNRTAVYMWFASITNIFQVLLVVLVTTSFIYVYRQLLVTTIHATFRFHDTTPQGKFLIPQNPFISSDVTIGRILNRFGKVLFQSGLVDVAHKTSGHWNHWFFARRLTPIS